MYKVLLVLATQLLISTYVYAESTPRGKIIYTQGHIVASCRTVQFQENGTGTIRYFRIADPGAGSNDNVQAVVLSALMANRDVTIYYDGATTGCGTEPRITYVTVF